MSALTVDPAPGHGQDWDDLVRIWEETDAPEGCKVEIIEGIVTVSPPPSKDHNTTAELLQRRLYTVIPEDWGIYQTLGVSVPGRAGLYIPDLVVVPRDIATGPGNRIPAEEARLVVEITSQANANHDRIGKVHGYAKAGCRALPPPRPLALRPPHRHAVRGTRRRHLPGARHGRVRREADAPGTFRTRPGHRGFPRQLRSTAAPR